MDQLKYGVLLSGLAGVVGCFLPLGGGITLWDAHSADMAGVMTVLGAFAVGALMGIVAVLKPPILRWQGLVATAAFVVVIIKMRGGIVDMMKDGAIGAKLIAIAPIAGVLFSILSMAIAAPAVARK